MSYLYIAHCFQHDDIYVYAQPSFHSCQEKYVTRWTQIHDKHGSGALLKSLVLVVLLSSGEQSISRPFVLSALAISEWETR